MTDLALFDLPTPPRHDCVHDGPCKTCGATRPADYRRHMFLEPVSGECLDCNHRTLAEILQGIRERRDVSAAWSRHYPPGARTRR